MPFEFDGIEFPNVEARNYYINAGKAARQKWRDEHAPPVQPELPRQEPLESLSSDDTIADAEAVTLDYSDGMIEQTDGGEAEQFETKRIGESPQYTAPKAQTLTSASEGQSVLDFALAYAAAGYKVIPLKPRGKDPLGMWKGPALTEAEIRSAFAGGTANIGVACGADSRGLVDIDFDSGAAARIADELLSKLPSYGRAGSPRSHRWVICKEASDEPDKCRRVTFTVPASLKAHPRLQGEHGAMILELRPSGCYSMAPPSIHPNGEKLIAEGNLLAPPQWFWPQLMAAGGLIAFLDLCVRLYPPLGYRNSFCLALAGTLLRALKHLHEFRQFDDESELVHFVDDTVRLVGDLAGGGKSHKLKHAGSSLARIKSNAKVTGLKTVLNLLGVSEADHGQIAAWLGGADKHDERPVIVYTELDDLRVLDETQTALLSQQVPIFQRSGQLVHVFRLDRDEQSAASSHGKPKWSRPAGSLIIDQIKAPRLRLYLSQHIRFLRRRITRDGELLVPIPAPMNVALDLLALKDRHAFRVLRGIAETPTLREDGSLLSAEGYDAESRIILDTNGATFDPVSDKPTKRDAERALEEIGKCIAEFPFDGNLDGNVRCASRTVALSLILSAVVVGSLDHVPLHLGDAAAAGTGKGQLGNVASIIATGRAISRMTQGRDEAEDEKRLVGAVLKGCPMLMIDNVEQPIGGDFLCTIITDARVNVRILGQTGQQEVEVRMLIYATGNNIKVRGDMTRRSLKCRMIANVEQPESRPFKIPDLDAYVTMHRGKLVSAALVIMRAFIVAPDRESVLNSLPRYNGFEKWSERVRAPLVWLGEVDPCETRDSIRDDDPVTGKLATLLASWANCSALGVGVIEADRDDGWYTVAQICARAEMTGGEDLKDALQAVLPKGTTDDALGRYLSKSVDRIVGDYRLRKRHQADTRRAQYLVERASMNSNCSEQTGQSASDLRSAPGVRDSGSVSGTKAC